MIGTFTTAEKIKARSICASARHAGKLVPQPCEKCGFEKTEAHHDDYSKPLEVIWLCLSCHREIHGFRKAHCVRGHKLTGHNLMMHRRGSGQAPKRKCRQCNNDAEQLRRQRSRTGAST